VPPDRRRCDGPGLRTGRFGDERAQAGEKLGEEVLLGWAPRGTQANAQISRADVRDVLGGDEEKPAAEQAGADDERIRAVGSRSRDDLLDEPQCPSQ
jgi:hypothetical protein